MTQTEFYILSDQTSLLVDVVDKLTQVCGGTTSYEAQGTILTQLGYLPTTVVRVVGNLDSVTRNTLCDRIKATQGILFVTEQKVDVIS